MADMSAEPSMEEILSSIKRIIAEEGEGTRPPPKRPQRVASPAQPALRAPLDSDEVLELSEPMSTPDRPADPTPPSAAAQFAPPPRLSDAPRVDPIVSHQAAVASRGSLDALTRLIVKPEDAAADNTLEGLVREMLRPMLREWLDARLPDMVEAMVAREIERITGSR